MKKKKKNFRVKSVEIDESEYPERKIYRIRTSSFSVLNKRVNLFTPEQLRTYFILKPSGRGKRVIVISLRKDIQMCPTIGTDRMSRNDLNSSFPVYPPLYSFPTLILNLSNYGYHKLL